MTFCIGRRDFITLLGGRRLRRGRRRLAERDRERKQPPTPADREAALSLAAEKVSKLN
jgi:hypothetical protein